MTKAQCRKKTRQLIRESAKHMRQNLEKLMICGGIDLDNYGDNYELPRIMINTLLGEEKIQYAPYTNDSRRAIENLSYFI